MPDLNSNGLCNLVSMFEASNKLSSHISCKASGDLVYKCHGLISD